LRIKGTYYDVGRKGEELIEEDAKKRHDRAETKYLACILGLLLIMASLGIAGMVYGTLGPDYRYNNAVHSHIENAYYAADPYTMKAELQACIDGMHELGLTEDMYSHYWWWEQTYDRSMIWQYDHLDSVLVRCDEFISWAENGTTQQLQDVYSAKLDAVVAFLKTDGWSDWIAKDAYGLKENFFFKMVAPIIVGFMAIGLLLCGLKLVNIERRDRNDFMDMELVKRYVMEEEERKNLEKEEWARREKEYDRGR